MKFIVVVLFLLFALVHGGLIAKKVSKEKTTEKTAPVENVDLSNESGDLIVDEIVTESSTNRNEDEAHTEEPPLSKDDKVKKSEKLTKSDTENITEKPIKATEKPSKDEENKQAAHNHDDNPLKKVANKLEEELKKIKDDPLPTQKPTQATTSSPANPKKSSKNNATSKDSRCFVVLTSFVVFLIAAFL
ncbi:hypothetical protein ACKWTF_000777 [Chironomus riparius]